MAAVDYFLKIDGIPGESSDAKHKGEIELAAYSCGAKNAGAYHSGGGSGTGRVVVGDLNFRKRVDKASPRLFKACCDGEPFKSATLTVRRAGKEQQEYQVIELTSVVVSGFNQEGGAGADVIPMDTVSLNFAKIEHRYKEQKPDGTLGGEVIGSWDITTNTAG